MAVEVVGVGFDHGIVADGVAEGDRGGIEEFLGELDVAGGGIR